MNYRIFYETINLIQTEDMNILGGTATVSTKIPDDLINELRPFYETEWEAKVREEQKRAISASEVLIRALSEIWAIEKGKALMPRFYRKAGPEEGAAARKYDQRPGP
jgi:hypothetical protein